MARKGMNTTSRKYALAIYERLHAQYPEAKVSLDYKTPLDLLVATIMAAQSTDARVNILTKKLFKKYRKPQDYLAVPIEELQDDIRQAGFFRQKAKSIVNACRRIIDVHRGKVPGTMEELVQLAGVGRKTANVVLGACFGKPGIIVDTHVGRLSGRLGFTTNTDPVKIEKDLMKILPEELWTQFSHTLVYHGRAICAARTPKCAICPVNDLCPYQKAHAGKK
jgi:endonuclease III